MIVGAAPGGGADITARLIVPKVGEALGQQVIVDNRPGAATMIGSAAVARAAPDGYTLLMGAGNHAINPAIHLKMPYDAERDFAPVSQIVTVPNFFVVHPSLPVKSVKELIAFARARPGQLDFGSSGLGGNPHLTMELFLSMTKLKMVHVPYKGVGPAIVDLVAGNVHIMSTSILSTIAHVNAGRLRALGVTSLTRAAVAPAVPTISEAGVPGYEATQWFGVLAPAGTPPDVVNRLQGAIGQALKDSEVRKRFADSGATPVGSAPDQFAIFIRAELRKWASVAKEAGIKPQ
jgi:tripartite-type tricarboxylate transporter receptor subunit TctC